MRKLFIALAAGVIAAALVGTALADSSAPPTLTAKNIRLDVTLQDVDGLTFDATLLGIPPSVPWAVHEYLNLALDDSTFEVDANAARCFVARTSGTGSVKCGEIADMLDEASDGIDASILARTVFAKDGSISFRAKKLTVWVNDAGVDVEPEPESMPPTVPPPPKFFQKSYRLTVSLNDVDGGVYDAFLQDVPASVPSRVRDYLWNALDGTFELHSGAAKCFYIRREIHTATPCSNIAELVDELGYEGIGATVLAQPFRDKDGDLAFKAKKISVWV